MKKTLALVLAFALVFSTITVAFAETTTATISADAKACADLGMLVGAGNGVTAEYTATTPSRLQAATMALRLKGLEAEAKAFKATENFADVDQVTYADGKAILGYLKAHKELGWVGNGTTFDPNSKVTAQQYYKTLLESLGYKQTTADVAGDFKFDETIAFAATKGLTKAATAATFTIDNLATATVEGLKATVKGGTKTLATTLVEAKALDQAKVDAALGTTAAPAAIKLSSAKAVANDKINVTFTGAVDKAFAEAVASYKLVVKGSTTALEVKSAALQSDTVVVLTTAKQTGGTAYTLTVGDVSVNLAGVAAQSGAPEIKGNVVGKDTNTVEVTFNKVMDYASTTNVANYTFDKSVVAKSIALSSSGKVATITTEGVANNVIYKVTVANVKSSDMVAITSVTKSFVGKTDIKAPTINKIVVNNNQRISVYFTDDHGIDTATANDIANYSISGGLKITGAVAKMVDPDNDDYYTYVEISTDAMTSGSTYTLTINKMVDGSVAKNAITSNLTKDFKGMSADKSAPTVNTVSATSDNMVKVTYTDTNRMDMTSMADMNNYTFDTGLTVVKAVVLNPAKPDDNAGKTVILTTAVMEKNKTYKLSIKNVMDEFGNVVSATNRTVVGRDADINPPYVTKVEWTSLTKVKLYFNKELDEATAKDPANYVLNNGLGIATKAEITATGTDAYKLVTITTATQTGNKDYKVTITGVKDLMGNVMSAYVAKFASKMDEAATTKPAVSSSDCINSKEVRLTFDKAVVATTATASATTDAGATINLTQVGSVLDDGTTVVFTYAAGFATSGTKYTVSAIAGIKDKNNNTYALPATVSDRPVFYSVSTAPTAPEVSTIEQVDAKAIRVTFTKPVLFTGAVTTFNPLPSVATTGDKATGITNFTGDIDKYGDETNDAYSTVVLRMNTGTIPFDKTFKFNFTGYVTDYVGTLAKDVDDTAANDNNHGTSITTYIKDTDAPYIDFVDTVDEQKVKVVFNENLSVLGSYKITDADGNAAGGTLTFAKDDSTNYGYDFNNIVYVKCSTALDPTKVYTIKPVAAAADIAGVSAKTDVSFNFSGSNVKVSKYITGVKIIDAKTIEVTANYKFGNTDTIKVYKDGATLNLVKQNGAIKTAAAAITTTFDETGVQNNATTAASKKFSLDQPLLADTTYYVELTGVAASGSEIQNDGALTAFPVTGLAADGGINFAETMATATTASTATDAGLITFSGMDAANYIVEVVYANEVGTTAYVVVPTLVVGPPATYKFDAATAAANNGAGTYTYGATGYTAVTNNIPLLATYVAGKTAGTDYIVGTQKTVTINVYRIIDNAAQDALAVKVAAGTAVTNADYTTAVSGQSIMKDGAVLYSKTIPVRP